MGENPKKQRYLKLIAYTLGFIFVLGFFSYHTIKGYASHIPDENDSGWIKDNITQCPQLNASWGLNCENEADYKEYACGYSSVLDKLICRTSDDLPTGVNGNSRINCYKCANVAAAPPPRSCDETRGGSGTDYATKVSEGDCSSKSGSNDTSQGVHDVIYSKTATCTGSDQITISEACPSCSDPADYDVTANPASCPADASGNVTVTKTRKSGRNICGPYKKTSSITCSSSCSVSVSEGNQSDYTGHTCGNWKVNNADNVDCPTDSSNNNAKPVRSCAAKSGSYCSTFDQKKPCAGCTALTANNYTTQSSYTCTVGSCGTDNKKTVTCNRIKARCSGDDQVTFKIDCSACTRPTQNSSSNAASSNDYSCSFTNNCSSNAGSSSRSIKCTKIQGRDCGGDNEYTASVSCATCALSDYESCSCSANGTESCQSRKSTSNHCSPDQLPKSFNAPNDCAACSYQSSNAASNKPYGDCSLGYGYDPRLTPRSDPLKNKSQLKCYRTTVGICIPSQNPAEVTEGFSYYIPKERTCNSNLCECSADQLFDQPSAWSTCDANNQKTHTRTLKSTLQPGSPDCVFPDSIKNSTNFNSTTKVLTEKEDCRPAAPGEELPEASLGSLLAFLDITGSNAWTPSSFIFHKAEANKVAAIGIGTTTPNEQLEISNNFDTTKTTRVRITDINHNPELQLQYDRDSGHWSWYVANGFGEGANNNDKSLRIWGNGADRVIIDQDGSLHAAKFCTNVGTSGCTELTGGDGESSGSSGGGINFIKNGGFENGTDNWGNYLGSSADMTMTIEAASALYGVNGMKIRALRAGSFGIQRTAKLPMSVGGKTFTASAWIKTTAGKRVILRMEDEGSPSFLRRETFVATGNWQYISVHAEYPASYEDTTINISIYFENAAISDELKVDNVSLSESSYQPLMIYTDSAEPQVHSLSYNDRFGLGIAYPKSMLHIFGGQPWGTDLSLDATGVGAGSTVGRRWNLISGAGNAGLNVGNFIIKDETAGRDRFIIDKIGNVGIGTNVPEKLLHLKTATGTNAELDIQSGEKAKWGIYHDEATEDLRFWNTDDRWKITKAGALIGGKKGTASIEREWMFGIPASSINPNETRNPDGSVANKYCPYGYTFVDDNNNGQYDNNECKGNAFVIEKSGEVGIGKTSPNERLEILDGRVLVTSSSATSIPPSYTGSFSTLFGASGIGLEIVNSSNATGVNKNSFATISADMDTLFIGGTKKERQDSPTGKQLTINKYVKDFTLNLMQGGVGIGTISPTSSLHVAESTGLTLGEDKVSGTANTAGVLKLISAGDNAYFTSFIAKDQVESITYRLPLKRGGAGTFLQNDGTDALHWVAESDPKVGTLTNTKWCTTDGAKINCSENAPALTESDPVVKALKGIVSSDGTTLAAITSSAGLSEKLTDETGSGSLVFGTTPTFTTSIITPSIIGGAAATSTLTLQGNSAATGNIPTNPNIQFKVGDGGAMTAMTILNNGNVGIGTDRPDSLLNVATANPICTKTTELFDNSSGTCKENNKPDANPICRNWNDKNSNGKRENGECRNDIFNVDTVLGTYGLKITSGQYYDGASMKTDTSWINVDIPGLQNVNISDNLIVTGGKLGVGTIYPEAPLHITHDGESTYGVVAKLDQNKPGNYDGPKLAFKKPVFIKDFMANGYTDWTLGIVRGAYDTHFAINSRAGTERGFGNQVFTIAESGSIGIGTIDPKAALDIKNFQSNDSIAILAYANRGVVEFRRIRDGSTISQGDTLIVPGQDPRIIKFVDETGKKLVIDKPFSNDIGKPSQPRDKVSSYVEASIRRAQPTLRILGENGGVHFVINSDGSVGIGTTDTKSAKLAVADSTIQNGGGFYVYPQANATVISARSISLPSAPIITGTKFERYGFALSVRFDWEYSGSNISNFIIEQQQPNGNFATVAIVEPTHRSYSDTSDQINKLSTITYRIGAIGSFGTTYSQPKTITRVVASQIPTPPSDVKATIINRTGYNTLELTWKDNSDNEERFIIQETEQDISFNGDMKRGSFVALPHAPANTQKVELGPRKQGYKYLYRVSAWNDAGPSSEIDSNIVEVPVPSSGSSRRLPNSPTPTTATPGPTPLNTPVPQPSQTVPTTKVPAWGGTSTGSSGGRPEGRVIRP